MYTGIKKFLSDEILSENTIRPLQDPRHQVAVVAAAAVEVVLLIVIGQDTHLVLV